MTVNPKEELKSCPFCGSKAMLFIDNNAYRKFYAFCSKEDCCQTRRHYFKYLCIKAWNKRTGGNNE